jgi:hypothetical protein
MLFILGLSHFSNARGHRTFIEKKSKYFQLRKAQKVVDVGSVDSLPKVVTNAITNISSNGATFNGSISNVNDIRIIRRGFVYATSTKPTFHINHSPTGYYGDIEVGKGIGIFDTILGYSDEWSQLLLSNTTYYVRSFAVTEKYVLIWGNEECFTTLSVGQRGQGGGWVFFDKGNSDGGWRYLEAAPTDQSSNTIWGCYDRKIVGTQSIVGSGKNNTEILVALACNDTVISAPQLSNNLELGEQNDWFLPSIDEFKLMFLNLHLNNQGNFSETHYWSSSGNAASPWSFIFNYGIAETNPKFFTNSVRAVRAF